MVRQYLPRDILFPHVVGRENGDAVVDFEKAAVILAPEVSQRIVKIERRLLIFGRIVIGR